MGFTTVELGILKKALEKVTDEHHHKQRHESYALCTRLERKLEREIIQRMWDEEADVYGKSGEDLL